MRRLLNIIWDWLRRLFGRRTPETKPAPSSLELTRLLRLQSDKRHFDPYRPARSPFKPKDLRRKRRHEARVAV